MIFDERTGHLRLGHFPLLASALERHMQWAADHAAVGEHGAAYTVLLDVWAIAAEITEHDEDLFMLVTSLATLVLGDLSAMP